MSVLFADGIYGLKLGIKTLGEQFEGVTVENLYFYETSLENLQVQGGGNCQQMFVVNETSN